MPTCSGASFFPLRPPRRRPFFVSLDLARLRGLQALSLTLLWPLMDCSVRALGCPTNHSLRRALVGLAARRCAARLGHAFIRCSGSQKPEAISGTAGWPSCPSRTRILLCWAKETPQSHHQPTWQSVLRRPMTSMAVCLLFADLLLATETLVNMMDFGHPLPKSSP